MKFAARSVPASPVRPALFQGLFGLLLTVLEKAPAPLIVTGRGQVDRAARVDYRICVHAGLLPDPHSPARVSDEWKE